MPLRTIKLTIEYDGTHFNGWQRQTKNQRTVQGEIEKALKIICKKPLHVIGAGRTDKGVHALGQTAHFKTTSELPSSTFLKALNAHLPEDIAIVNVEDVNDNFHAQFSAKAKIYRYTILNRKMRSAFYGKICCFYPYRLNVSAMRKEAKSLIGKKDFKSFAASDPALKRTFKEISTLREIRNVSVQKKGDFIDIDIEGDGFLYRMVRNIAGTLLDIGSGRLPKGSIKKILSKKNRQAASPTAPAQGLCLMKVRY